MAIVVAPRLLSNPQLPLEYQLLPFSVTSIQRSSPKQLYLQLIQLDISWHLHHITLREGTKKKKPPSRHFWVKNTIPVGYGFVPCRNISCHPPVLPTAPSGQAEPKLSFPVPPAAALGTELLAPIVPWALRSRPAKTPRESPWAFTSGARRWYLIAEQLFHLSANFCWRKNTKGGHGKSQKHRTLSKKGHWISIGWRLLPQLACQADQLVEV